MLEKPRVGKPRHGGGMRSAEYRPHSVPIEVRPK